MSDLRQASNGKWKIVGIKHDQPGISIPAEYTYNGSKKTFNITTSKKTIPTDWETPLGEAIKLSDITRTYSDVVDGGKIYRVKLPENFTIHPADTPEPDPTITLKLSPTTAISSGGGTIRYTATTTPTDTEIEVKCSNNLSIVKTTKTGSFSVPANSSESQITYYVSAYCADNPRIIATGSVKQAAYVPPVVDEFSVSQIQSSFNYGGGTLADAFTITNPQGHAWTSSAPDWVELTPDNGNSTTGIYLEVQGRDDGGTQERTGNIIITDAATSKEYTVTVRQKGEEEDQFNVTQISGYIFPYTGETKNSFFTITNPQGHSWTATCPVNWVLVGKSSGSDGGPINVTVTGRDDALVSPRLSDITVKDLETNKTYTISVKQAGYTPTHGVISFQTSVTGLTDKKLVVTVSAITTYEEGKEYCSAFTHTFSKTETVNNKDLDVKLATEGSTPLKFKISVKWENQHSAGADFANTSIKYGSYEKTENIDMSNEYYVFPATTFKGQTSCYINIQLTNG